MAKQGLIQHLNKTKSHVATMVVVVGLMPKIYMVLWRLIRILKNIIQALTILWFLALGTMADGQEEASET